MPNTPVPVYSNYSGSITGTGTAVGSLVTVTVPASMLLSWHVGYTEPSPPDWVTSVDSFSGTGSAIIQWSQDAFASNNPIAVGTDWSVINGHGASAWWIGLLPAPASVETVTLTFRVFSQQGASNSWTWTNLNASLVDRPPATPPFTVAGGSGTSVASIGLTGNSVQTLTVARSFAAIIGA